MNKDDHQVGEQNTTPGRSSGVAIRQVIIEHLDQDITGLEGFQHVLVVFRFRRVVVGTAWFPVRNGMVRAAQLQSEVSQIAWPVWQQCAAQMKQPASQPPTATVVVCTRNRTDELAAGISALVRLAEQGHQVLVVDNCPSDDSTARLVASYPGIKYIFEPRAGLDVARNRGLCEASGEVAAFIDDDAIPDEGWLEALLVNFDDPMVAVVTGLTLPLELETHAQQWFETTNSFSRGFERRNFDATTMSVLGTGRVGAGVNMAIRRSVLKEIGLFDEALDGGTPTLSGGDQEFFYRTLAHGYRIAYEPNAVVWHKHRREWEQLRQTIFGYGVGLFAWWTRALVVEKEYTLLYWGTRWFIQHHLGKLIRSLLKRPGHIPIDLALAEFSGALVGPLRYLSARRALSRQFRDAPLARWPAGDESRTALEAVTTDSALPLNESPISRLPEGVEIL